MGWWVVRWWVRWVARAPVPPVMRVVPWGVGVGGWCVGVRVVGVRRRVWVPVVRMASWVWWWGWVRVWVRWWRVWGVGVVGRSMIPAVWVGCSRRVVRASPQVWAWVGCVRGSLGWVVVALVVAYQRGLVGGFGCGFG
ncbi:hypothetical protein SAV14893_099060 [Streptomyces avermitilis]|uniref:Uncharacterized protein n=1 Tax=Streptomyces avermitilis TaxID=33903 RepID=A0A4D4MEY6_STRAX|nr:hypothetical protein SAV14893_099060 [Streptomyces avermitilis]